METEQLPRNIEQWYEQVTNLDKHWRKSKREEERLREREEIGPMASRSNFLANAERVKGQQLP